jgi:hypothetical protein
MSVYRDGPALCAIEAGVWLQFALALLADPDHGVLQYVQHPEHACHKAVVLQTIEVYRQWIVTGIPPTAAVVETITDVAALMPYVDALSAAAVVVASYAMYAAADATLVSQTARAAAQAAPDVAHARRWQVLTVLRLCGAAFMRMSDTKAEEGHLYG